MSAPTSARPRPSGDPRPESGFRLPEIPGPWATAVAAWRRLRRMSTALLLLFALAVATVIATFIPQQPVIPPTVAQWRAGEAGPGEEVARLLDAAGLFDVFGSWWFTVLLVLLFVSLTGCLVPRWRAFGRTVRRPPNVGRNLHLLRHRRVLQTRLDPAAALTAARDVLERSRFRTRRVSADRTDSGRERLAAERGLWREGGSLLFHTAFYLLLLGAVVGHAFGFVGQINLVEGSGFTDTRIAYDRAEPGRFFGLDDHRGFTVQLDDFDASWFADGVPRDFVSTVTLLEDGQPVRQERIRVNHPLTHNGMKLYQVRFGMAPRVVVRAGDVVLFDEPVLLSDAGGSVWTGVAKVASGSPDSDVPQIALDLVLLTDADLVDGVPVSRGPEPRNPRLIAQLYVGDDLGLQRPVPASDFDRDAGEVIGPAILAPGASQELAGGALAVEFPELRWWSGFQVTHAPGRVLLLGAGILVLAGLIPSLYSYRRRCWVDVAPATGPSAVTEVVLAGVAAQRKATFADEFAGLADDLRTALPPPTQPSRPPTQVP